MTAVQEFFVHKWVFDILGTPEKPLHGEDCLTWSGKQMLEELENLNEQEENGVI